MLIDFATLSPNQVYHAMIQSVVPRPIAWVLSENDNDSFNLAPFSYFNAVASDPPLLMFSVGPKPGGGLKDTTINIRDRQRFVVHIASKALAPSLNTTSAGLEYGQSELTLAGLESTEFGTFELPRIQRAPIAFACQLHKIDTIGNAPMSLIFGEVKQAYFSDELIEQQGNRLQVQANKLDPLARLGGSDYADLGDIFTLPRP